MKLVRLSMGCLSSRSTIAPTDSIEVVVGSKKEGLMDESANNNNKLSSSMKQQANGSLVKQSSQQRQDSGDGESLAKSNNSGNGAGKQRRHRKSSAASNTGAESEDNDIMSILMDAQNKENNRNIEVGEDERSNAEGGINLSNGMDLGDNEDEESADGSQSGGKKPPADGEANNDSSFYEKPDIDLLRQYVAVDYEINQLEDKDTLRVYHEKIEQLEQLERELDMIGSEVEEVATRNEPDFQNMDRLQSPSSLEAGGGVNLDSNMKAANEENNSILSGATGSISHKSDSKQTTKTSKEATLSASGVPSTPVGLSGKKSSRSRRNLNDGANMQYSSVEEVFNRKIILEKERDKLKKEVEMVIVECDRLQQRYKRRDEILDKLFDGRAGNGLENHLEQQLNWLLEQKRYVDQVFYAWKRAETLTSQTCEQFATALELLKRLPKIQDPEQRSELAENIGQLLIKSRQDMEQAQKYNPNVDAPFFTESETERFDKIIETISSNSVSAHELSQTMTVIQFAYKRAVSIRLWLEQILQTTIARDSFELSEEYKWIAIQLRKERINLIKAELREPPYAGMVQSVMEEMSRQQHQLHHHQQQQQQQQQQRPASNRNQRHSELNRDSGVESEANDVDIEEEIYRLLEMNKARLERSTDQQAASGKQQSIGSGLSSAQLKVAQNLAFGSNASSSSMESPRDQLLRDRIDRRVRDGQQQQALSSGAPARPSATGGGDGDAQSIATTNNDSSNNNPARRQQQQSAGSGSGVTKLSQTSTAATPTKLRVELDEEARQSLLKQVDQIHTRHRSRIETLRGSNKAKANSKIMNRMQQQQQQQEQQQQPTTAATIREQE